MFCGLQKLVENIKVYVIKKLLIPRQTTASTCFSLYREIFYLYPN